MREKQPKLKVDQLFGPDLIPPAKRFPMGFVCGALLIAIGVVVGFYWGSPWWLQRELKYRLMDVADRDQALELTEALLQIEDQGIVTVVGALGHPKPEVAKVVQEVLRSKLSVMKTEELVSDPWVKRLATELKEQAGSWGPQARELGCELAADILSAFQTANDSVEGDGLKWSPARLDCWAVLETHRLELDESLRQESARSSASNPSVENHAEVSDAGEVNLPRRSGVVTNGVVRRTLDDAIGESIAADLVGNSPQRSLSDETEGSNKSDAASGLGEVDPAPSLQVLTVGPDGRAATNMSSEGGSIQGEVDNPAMVQFGRPKIVEAHDVPMAHISVRSTRGNGDLRRAPALVQSTPKTLNAVEPSDGEDLQSRNGVRSLGPAAEDLSNVEASWQGKVQTIDARYPQSQTDFTKKETLAVIEYLRSEDPAVQGAAVLELERRKLSPQEINLAIELLRGDSKRKKELIIGLATSGIENPRPWYVWMAQDQDREVRRAAIHALGGMQDPEVTGILRELSSRESDPELEQTLRKILSQGER